MTFLAVGRSISILTQVPIQTRYAETATDQSKAARFRLTRSLAELKNRGLLWSFATACAFSSGLALGIRFGTEDFDHLSVLENNGVLVGFRVAQTNGALLTHRLGFFDGVREEMRLMATVAFVG